jgi:hypothetical protein
MLLCFLAAGPALALCAAFALPAVLGGCANTSTKGD